MKLDVKFAGNSRTFSTCFSGTTFIHDGQNGATFVPAVSDDGILTWSNDRDLPNPDPVCIRGADGRDGRDGAVGAKGDKGDKGDRGEHGLRGIQGIQGAPGVAGKDGKDGADGAPGKDGVDGYTPVRGTDYWTDADRADIIAAVIDALPVYGGETA